jgi:hypothetical protein
MEDIMKKIINKLILFGGGFFTGFIFEGKIVVKTKFEPWSLFDTLIIIILAGITFLISIFLDKVSVKEEK